MSLARGILAAAVICLMGVALTGLTGGEIDSDLVRLCLRSEIMEKVKALAAAVLALSLGKTTLNILSFIVHCRMKAYVFPPP